MSHETLYSLVQDLGYDVFNRNEKSEHIEFDIVMTTPMLERLSESVTYYAAQHGFISSPAPLSEDGKPIKYKELRFPWNCIIHIQEGNCFSITKKEE